MKEILISPTSHIGDGLVQELEKLSKGHISRWGRLPLQNKSHYEIQIKKDTCVFEMPTDEHGFDVFGKIVVEDGIPKFIKSLFGGTLPAQINKTEHTLICSKCFRYPKKTGPICYPYCLDLWSRFAFETGTTLNFVIYDPEDGNVRAELSQNATLDGLELVSAKDFFPRETPVSDMFYSLLNNTTLLGKNK